MLVSASIVGRLCGHPRLWAHREMKRGRFGPVVEGKGKSRIRSGDLLVELQNVEAELGRFSPLQLTAAGISIRNTEED